MQRSTVCTGTRQARWLAATAALCLLAGCGPAADAPPTFQPRTPQEAAALHDYTAAVKPILRENCYRCHAGLNKKGGFNLGTRAQVLAGGHHGPAVVPGRPEQSLLMVVVRHQGPPEHPMPMPQKGELLPEKDLATLARWIADGAIMDR